ncbi:TetR family transcriptional regulator [Rhodococcus triatomae]|uniref:DNA-binding transcriptional regulator, AcrR family n=1 Tax=Rhodococcus triatomae TaxID=300028 RepID=A0A1G8DZK2_9NOCA|nr:TetR/AcrR family transcriptional regulator [Rhodococcus triatomae]QNG18313.1 TetR family transcriptional regulator [Rhodococcus triatomae]QNG22017.1 TetR family transcriptional regulator [Rhodococcus triatomae]SDH62879.1 DNA-binding transcriptional regulator, AcrR family [Rhodococcus triatomae]
MLPNSDRDGQSRSFIEEARRAQIVTAAVETIAEVGYHRASMGRIGTRAGISRGLISYHFAGKSELISQVITTVYSDAAAFMTPVIDAEATPAGQLRAYIGSNLEYMRAYPARMVAIVEILTGGGLADLPDADPAEFDRQMLLPLEQLFAAGQASGEFRDFDVTVMARIVRSAIDLVPTALSRDPDLDIDRYLREITTALDHATRPVPSTSEET